MENEQLVPLSQFCAWYEIEVSFIESLTEAGLVDITIVSGTPYVVKEHISEIERFMRLYHDLQINSEGIDVIHHLVERIKNMQGELNALRNRLRIYEDL